MPAGTAGFVTAGLHGRLPGRFSQEKQGVKARKYANFMALDLILPAPGVLGLCGSQTFIGLQFAGIAVGALRAFLEFHCVVFEVIIHPIQLAPEKIFLPDADDCQFFREFHLQCGAEEFAASAALIRAR